MGNFTFLWTIEICLIMIFKIQTKNIYFKFTKID